MVNSDSQNRKKSIFQTFFTNMSYDFLENRTKMKFKTKKFLGFVQNAVPVTYRRYLWTPPKNLKTIFRSVFAF